MSQAMIADVQASNLPAKEKSAITSLIARVRGGTASLSGAAARAKMHMAAGGQALRQGGEAGVVGGLLGVLHAEKGLDMNVKGHSVPVDGVVAAVALAGSVALAHEEFGPDLRNAGSAALSILAFRKGAELWAKKRGKAVPSLSAHGEDVEFGFDDPIAAIANGL